MSKLLQALSYPTIIITYPSTGKSSPGAPTMHDDISAIRTSLLPLIEADKEIVLVMHSLGGCLGSNAIEGFGIEARKKDGKKGGIMKLVYLSVGLLPEGEPFPEELPLYDLQVSVPSPIV